MGKWDVGAMLASRVTPDNSNSYSYGVDCIFRVFGDDYLSVSVALTTDTLGNNMNRQGNLFYRFNWERRSQEGFAYSLSSVNISYVSASVQFPGAYNYSYVEFPVRNQKMNSHVARLKVLYMQHKLS